MLSREKMFRSGIVVIINSRCVYPVKAFFLNKRKKKLKFLNFQEKSLPVKSLDSVN